MIPVDLHTQRLMLDQPTLDDVPAITAYCRDPLFERYLLTPWPYEERHAVAFVTEYVPAGWADGSEFTWSLRQPGGGPLLGVAGYRAGRGDLGFWLGAPHRGHGYMPEAVHSVLDFAFAGGAERVRWECIRGNSASAAVARRCGFTFTGERPSWSPARDGSHPSAWHGELPAEDDRTEKTGWPG